MHVLPTYSAKDFDSFPVVMGRIVCPMGDYSAVQKIPKHSLFPGYCKFGKNTEFGIRCYLGPYCEVGAHSTLGANSKAGDYVQLGAHCKLQEQVVLGNYCQVDKDVTFDHSCVIGNSCSIGERVVMGINCTIGAKCQFGAGAKIGVRPVLGANPSFGEGSRVDNCLLRDVEVQFLALEGTGSARRRTYFYNGFKTIMVRSGCFYGTLTEFRAKVLEDCSVDSLKAKQYLGMANIAALTFGRMKMIEA